ncbi:serine/arginine repetitive matrix protein 1-like isoform X2 [Phyllopteryx taeniolatus]|uniref:serine/arginine repetitive matrix protein 1-like isoform X2 n=1 Tax=Phyllopteryx taeniolatus TaxID=161469 RepID=UPI002AD202FD|nr:serine/arginine repetitive matrix protein 1-like isoform X2 [Phyllopteryx taeniolatus]
MSPTQPTSGGKGYASSRRSTAIPVRSADKKRSPTGPTSCKRWKQARGTTGGHPPAARAGDPAGTAPAPTEHGRVTITPPILPRRSPQWSPNPPHPQDQKGVKKVPPLQTPEQQTQGHEKNIPTPCMCPHHPNRSKMCKNTNKNK